MKAKASACGQRRIRRERPVTNAGADTWVVEDTGDWCGWREVGVYSRRADALARLDEYDW